MVSQPIRLNKFLAERLGCSRREADELIQSGRISIGQKPASIGVKIDKNDEVWYNGKIVPFDAEYSYLALNKPVGYVCSRHQQGDTPTVYSLLPRRYQALKTVGRLDKDSSGLILFTNNGDFAFRMTHPKFRKTKVYEVELDHSLGPIHQQMISDYGVMLDDGVSKFKVITSAGDAVNEEIASAGDGCGGGPPPSLRGGGGEQPAGPAEEVVFAAAAGPSEKTGTSPAGPAEHKPGRTRFTVILTEGRNRQIRRTFAALGYRVTRLHRTNFGKYELGDLAPGRYVIIEP